MKEALRCFLENGEEEEEGKVDELFFFALSYGPCGTIFIFLSRP